MSDPYNSAERITSATSDPVRPHLASVMDPLSFDELTIELKRSVYWGFLWRSFLASLAAGLAAGIAAFLIGLVLALAGVRVGVAAGLLIGLGFGLVMWWFYIRWMFRVNLGGYNLRLVREAPPPRKRS